MDDSILVVVVLICVILSMGVLAIVLPHVLQAVRRRRGKGGEAARRKHSTKDLELRLGGIAEAILKRDKSADGQKAELQKLKADQDGMRSTLISLQARVLVLERIIPPESQAPGLQRPIARDDNAGTSRDGTQRLTDVDRARRIVPTARPGNASRAEAQRRLTPAEIRSRLEECAARLHRAADDWIEQRWHEIEAQMPEHCRALAPIAEEMRSLLTGMSLVLTSPAMQECLAQDSERARELGGFVAELQAQVEDMSRVLMQYETHRQRPTFSLSVGAMEEAVRRETEAKPGVGVAEQESALQGAARAAYSREMERLEGIRKQVRYADYDKLVADYELLVHDRTVRLIERLEDLDGRSRAVGLANTQRVRVVAELVRQIAVLAGFETIEVQVAVPPDSGTQEIAPFGEPVREQHRSGRVVGVLKEGYTRKGHLVRRPTVIVGEFHEEIGSPLSEAKDEQSQQ